MLFVYAMLTMSACAAVLAVGGAWAAVNIPAALLTAYLVITALTTVRPPSAGSRWLDAGLMLMALALGLTTLTFGFQALAAGGNRNGIPAFPFLMFGAVGLLASAGDLRVIRSGALRGAPRLARHLWRMCWALWIAASSFFLGPRARGEDHSGAAPQPRSTRAASAGGVRGHVVLAVARPRQTDLSGHRWLPRMTNVRDSVFPSLQSYAGPISFLLDTGGAFL